MTSKQKRISRLLIAVLSVLLIAEFIPLYGAENRAFAEDDKEVKVDEPAITLGEEEPEPEADVEIDAGEILDEEGNAVEPDSVPAVFPEEKEKKPAKKKLNEGYDFSAIDPATADEISVGKVPCDIVTNGATATYVFKPDESGKYIFTTEGSADTCGQVLLDEGNDVYTVIGEPDDQSGTGDNFLISFSATAGNTYYLQAKPWYDKTASFDVVLMKDEYSASLKVTLNKKTGMATVKGTVKGDTFDKLYIDGNEVGSFSGTRKVNMKKYDIGYHSFYATLNYHPDVKVVYRKAIPTLIYKKPANKISWYLTKSNRVSLYYGGDTYYKPSVKDYGDYLDVYMQYKVGRKAWTKKFYGPVSTSSGTLSGKSGFKPNKKVKVRLAFAKKVTYGNKTYAITSKTTGKTSRIVTVKTGGKKLKVKSIKITKAKVTSHIENQPVWSSGWTGTMFYTYISGYKRVRVYQTTFKVTVKLKKKPGTKGIYIGNKRLKGNKKKYVTTFTQAGKLKGKKLIAKVYSYQSTKYGGYSKIYKKKVRVK